MLHDDAIQIEFDPPDPDLICEHYLEICRRAGVEPVSRERADKLITEGSAALAAGLTVASTTH